MRCHDCEAKEGQLHGTGCDMEICPLCDDQLLTCGCQRKHGGEGGPLDNASRIPWVEVPNLCRMCGTIRPELFMVSDETWQTHVPPTLQREVLCRDCYGRILRLFPEGWESAEVGDD